MAQEYRVKVRLATQNVDDWTRMTVRGDCVADLKEKIATTFLVSPANMVSLVIGTRVLNSSDVLSSLPDDVVVVTVVQPNQDVQMLIDQAVERALEKERGEKRKRDEEFQKKINDLEEVDLSLDFEWAASLRPYRKLRSTQELKGVLKPHNLRNNLAQKKIY